MEPRVLRPGVRRCQPKNGPVAVPETLPGRGGWPWVVGAGFGQPLAFLLLPDRLRECREPDRRFLELAGEALDVPQVMLNDGE